MSHLLTNDGRVQTRLWLQPRRKACNPALGKLIGRFGITRSKVVPFGFKDAYFYDQIQYATGMMHAFTYTFTDDVVGFFAALIHETFK